MSAELRNRIHLANAALITDPLIWPGTLIASHNTLGDIASELGVAIQAHPVRTLGTLVEKINPSRARIESGHQGFRSERYPWDILDRNPKRMLVKTLVCALHHYGPTSLRHIYTYQAEMRQGPLPTTIYAANKVRADKRLGKQTIQLSRADAKGLNLLSGDYDPLTSEKLDRFLSHIMNMGYGLCIDTLHSHSLIKQSGMDWETTLNYLLNKQQYCTVNVFIKH